MDKYFKIRTDYERVKNAVDTATTVFVVEEKIDGSQIRGEIKPDGSMLVGSKEIDFDELHPPDKMFTLGQQKMLEALGRLADRKQHIVLYGEYLQSTRHNSIHYERVPKNNIYLFDAKINGVWQDEPSILSLAQQTELEPVNTLFTSSKMPNMESLKPFLAEGSILGGQREGVVIKNRGIKFFEYTVVFFATKVVNEKFKELNKKVWETENRAGVKSIDDLAQNVVSAIQVQALWNKAIQHLRDEGNSQHSMRDIPKLIELLEKDVADEFEESIKEQLYSLMKRHILRKITSQFPVYYKQYLIDELASNPV